MRTPDPQGGGPLAPGSTAPVVPPGRARAVVWRLSHPEAPGELERLLSRRSLAPERVDSAPAAVLAAMRLGVHAAALILVDPASLNGAREAVSVLRGHLPWIRCWRFEPPPAGPGGGGLLGPIGDDLHPAAAVRRARDARPGDAAGGGRSGGSAERARLSREELAMLLGPTRTLAGDAG